MYLTSFVHRQDLFEIAERWFCGRPRRTDALRLTQILICDGFIVGVTLESIARSFLPIVYERTFYEKRIRTKGELRDAICLCTSDVTPRVLELCRRYQETPDFYYREAPINGVMCVDEHDQLLGLYRIKRPKRIAEKANRHFAAWLFKAVQNKARRMAEDRAQEWGIPIEYLVTPEKEMEKEFVEAERSIARSFLDGRIEFDRAPLTINDVGGIKVLGEPEKVARLESFLESHPNIRIVEREELRGHYQATNLILDVEWDPELVCRRYRDSRSWENYLNRGIPEDTLKRTRTPHRERGPHNLHRTDPFHLPGHGGIRTGQQHPRREDHPAERQPGIQGVPAHERGVSAGVSLLGGIQPRGRYRASDHQAVGPLPSGYARFPDPAPLPPS